MVKVELGHKVNNSAHKIAQNGGEVMVIVGRGLEEWRESTICCLSFSEIMSLDKKRWLKGKWSEGKFLRYSYS